MRLALLICLAVLGVVLSVVEAKPKARPLKVKARVAVKVNSKPRVSEIAEEPEDTTPYPQCQSENVTNCENLCPTCQCCPGLICAPHPSSGICQNATNKEEPSVNEISEEPEDTTPY